MNRITPGVCTWIPRDSALRKAAASPSRNSENTSGNVRIQAGTIPEVRPAGLRDVAWPKSNLHVIRRAGRTTDRSSAKVGADLRGAHPFVCPVSVETSPRSSKETRGRRARSIVTLVEFSSSSSSTYFNCSFDAKLLVEIISH